MTHTQHTGRDRAVSPIIGIILMVAITVILAAVVGTFVLDFGDSVQKNVQAGATITHEPDNELVRITWASNQNANHLDVNVSATNSSGASLGTYDERLDTVGDVATIDCVSEFGQSGAQVHVTVTGHQGDSSTVILSKTVDEC